MRGTIDGRRGKCGCECEMRTKQSQSDAGEGSSECKSSGRRKREKMKESILRDGEIALSKSCANDSLLPFLLSAAADAGKQLFDDVSSSHPAISSALISFRSVCNFSLRSIATERFKGRALCMRARAATEIKARTSSHSFVISNGSRAVICRLQRRKWEFPRSIVAGFIPLFLLVLSSSRHSVVARFFFFLYPRL